MNPPAKHSRLGAEFDAFLFASIGEDRNGMPLTVVSLLGRKDLDPWQEAASLAGLPAETAARRLTSLLVSVPNATLQRPDPGAMASRLVALLPGRIDSNTRLPETSVGSGEGAHRQAVASMIFFVIYMIFMVATQFAIERLKPTQADAAHTPASLTSPSQTPPAPAGQ